MNVITNAYYELLQKFGLYKDIPTKKRLQKLYSSVGYACEPKESMEFNTKLLDKYSAAAMDRWSEVNIDMRRLRNDLRQVAEWQDCYLAATGDVHIAVETETHNTKKAKHLVQAYLTKYTTGIVNGK